MRKWLRPKNITDAEADFIAGLAGQNPSVVGCLEFTPKEWKDLPDNVKRHFEDGVVRQ